jgi:hypothetical protein
MLPAEDVVLGLHHVMGEVTAFQGKGGLDPDQAKLPDQALSMA